MVDFIALRSIGAAVRFAVFTKKVVKVSGAAPGWSPFATWHAIAKLGGGARAGDTVATVANDDLENLPDVRDGLTEKERAILYCLQKTQEELGGRNVPTIMLYGRVLELVDIGEDEFQRILARFAGMTKQGSD